MNKCYICGKITGLPVAEYTAKFRKAEITVSILGYEPVNPVTLPHNHDKSWQSYMREAIANIVTCEAIYILSDWQDSRGGNIEVPLAKELGMKLIYEVVTEFEPAKIVRERDTYNQEG